MLNILDFIDSKDIREYNKDTKFTPIEQAVLIELSQKAVLSKKLDGWNTLLDFYSEEEFQSENVGKLSECVLDYPNNETAEKPKTDNNISFRKIISDTVSTYKSVLDKRYDKDDDVIYIAEFSENPEYRATIDDCRFFRDYDSAYEYLVKCRNEYIDDRLDISNINVSITREKFYTGNNDDEIYKYLFNSNLEIADVYYPCQLNNSEYFLSDFYISIPHLFKVGDLVKVINGCEENNVYYGVLGGLKEETENMHRDIGDYTDMEKYIDVVYEKNGKMYYGHQHAVLTQLERCTAEELPEKESEMLLLMSDTLKRNISAENLLQKYSHNIDLCNKGE